MTKSKNQTEDLSAADESDADATGVELAPEPIDLMVSVEPFEITPDMVVANLFASAHDAIELPEEMKGTVERIWRDADFTWPTTISVTRITLSTEDAEGSEPPQNVWSRISILGTGWVDERPVSLTLNNAFGFSGASVALPEVQPTDNGFFGVDLILKTTPRKHAEYVWGAEHQLVLLAQQKSDDGRVVRETEQRALPPHILWQWVR